MGGEARGGNVTGSVWATWSRASRGEGRSQGPQTFSRSSGDKLSQKVKRVGGLSMGNKGIEGQGTFTGEEMIRQKKPGVSLMVLGFPWDGSLWLLLQGRPAPSLSGAHLMRPHHTVPQSLLPPPLHIRMHTYTYACTHVCKCTHVDACTHVYVCTHTCTHM